MQENNETSPWRPLSEISSITRDMNIFLRSEEGLVFEYDFGSYYFKEAMVATYSNGVLDLTEQWSFMEIPR